MLGGLFAVGFGLVLALPAEFVFLTNWQSMWVYSPGLTVVVVVLGIAWPAMHSMAWALAEDRVIIRELIRE